MFELPADAAAALAALRFCEPDTRGLTNLTASEWTNLLTRHDFLRLSIPLRQTCSQAIPAWVRSRIDRHIADNTERLGRIVAAYSEVAAALQKAGAAHVVIKGFAQFPGFTDHPCFHAQSDIDLYCPPDSLTKANDAVLALGYRPLKGKKHAALDHLPPLIRRNGWQWRGNYFDPEMPPSIELHHCLWDRATFRFGVQIEGEFWSRRAGKCFDGLCFPALSLVDNFGHSALHILKDCLLDAASPAKLYEMARFLHLRRDDEAFWLAWSELHSQPLRLIEAVSCRMAADVFECRLPEAVAKEIRDLPPAIQKWFQQFGNSIFDRALHRPGAGIWLQTALVETSRDRRSVVIERLWPRRPISLDAFADREQAVRAPEQAAIAVRRKYRQYLGMRLKARARSFLPTLWQGARYWWSTKDLRRRYWNLFATSFIFDLGAYIFFLLYNLYLLDRGFNARFIGLVTSAAAIGSVAGTVLGGLMAQRFGLRRTLLLCFPLVATVFAARATLVAPAALLSLAFVGGAATTLWAVGLSPAVAQFTNDDNRSLGFSVILSTGIGVGVLGGFAGGHLPGWFSATSGASALQAKHAALLVASALIALAAWPISRIRFAPLSARKRTLYPRNPFLLRFLPAIAVWSFVTGSFTPFFNAYFSQHERMSVGQIGTMFSISHFSQLAAVLVAPFLFRRVGLVNGIIFTQVAAGISLALLAAAPAGIGAGVAYTAFSAFEWMNEPGVFTLLMNRVSSDERTGASALMFLVISLSQSAAAALAGAGFSRFGYPPVMFVTSIVAWVAAALFGTMLRDAYIGGPASAEESVA